MKKIRGRKIQNQRRILLAGIISITFILSVCYAAFITNITLTAKGNIKDINLYVSSNGSDVDGNGTKEKPYQTIGKAYDAAPKKATIFIMDDITQTSTITMNQNKKITLTSYSKDDSTNSIIRGNELTNYILIQTNGELTLKKITIDGNEVEATREMVYSNTNIVIEKGITIKNSNRKNGDGSGIYIGSNGILTMNDGIITNNTTTNSGGGIYGSQNSQININGGTISENKSQASGGGISSYGILNINGNTKIIKNESNWSGGGIYLNHATCTIDNVLIDNNKVTGPYAGAGITVHNNSVITLNNGVISNNIATSGSGSGVRLTEYSTFIMNGGIIKNNSSENSGGIYKNSNSAYTYKSGIVCENTPTNSYETHETCPQ